ncbi:radical SAM protein [Candidatus Wolfebacteria bacterium]|nr:radical SAM protein [Candidatus Wolfebacteria bacterium]
MSKFIMSPNLFVVTSPKTDSVMVYNILFGNPKVLNPEGLKFLNLFKNIKSENEIKKLVDGDASPFIKEFSGVYFLISPDFDERKFIEKRRNIYLAEVKRKKTIEHISLSVSNICNFGCHHCMFFQHNRDFVDEGKIMSWETAKKCIDTYISLMEEVGTLKGRIHFGNAEPLINWQVIKQVMEYCRSFSKYEFEYAINTNLYLLNEKMARTFKDFKVQIATSLDGLEKANDLIRITRNGQGTFRAIVDKINLLEKINYPLDGISITVTEKNFPFIDTDIVDFAWQRGMKSMAFDYDLVNIINISCEEKVKKIMRLKSYADKLDIYFDGTWGTPFRRLISRSLIRDFYSFCSAVEGRGLTFNPDGSIKACDYSKNKIGEINHLNKIFISGGSLFKLVEMRFPGNNSFCRNCMIESFCGGQCHITQTANKNISAFCDFYKAITLALLHESLEDS